jgi:hypothetical protein
VQQLRTWSDLDHSSTKGKIVVMSVERLSVSLESELADAVRIAASAESLNVSAWMAQAAH